MAVGTIRGMLAFSARGTFVLVDSFTAVAAPAIASAVSRIAVALTSRIMPRDRGLLDNRVGLLAGPEKTERGD